MKQEQILEAAIKRLSHFGVHKTTFSEIAQDLDMSKQALMYYYHDKPALVTSVIDKIVCEYLQEITTLVTNCDGLSSIFTELVDIRHRFFAKYHMLFVQMEMEGLGRNPEFEKVKQNIRSKEEELLAKKVKDAIKKGEIKPVDALHTVQLVLETLTAYNVCLHVQSPIPAEVEFNAMSNRQKEVVTLIIKGLKN